MDISYSVNVFYLKGGGDMISVYQSYSMGQILPTYFSPITHARVVTWSKTLLFRNEAVMGNPAWNVLFWIFPKGKTAMFIQRFDS